MSLSAEKTEKLQEFIKNTPTSKEIKLISDALVELHQNIVNLLDRIEKIDKQVFGPIEVR